MIKQLFFLAACFSSMTDAASAVPLRYSAQAAGGGQTDVQTSLVAGVNAGVMGSNLAGYLYGTTDWNVSASTVGGVLAANLLLHSVATSPPNVAPSEGGFARADIEDTLYFSHGQVVPLSLTLDLTGACNGTAGTNSNGTARHTCEVRAYVAIGPNVFFEITSPGTKTDVYFLNIPPGVGDYAQEISYSLTVQGSATNGFASGDFSHTARLFISAPGVTLRTESGLSYALVPEPSVPLLLAIGSLGFGLARHASRHSAGSARFAA